MTVPVDNGSGRNLITSAVVFVLWVQLSWGARTQGRMRMRTSDSWSYSIRQQHVVGLQLGKTRAHAGAASGNAFKSWFLSQCMMSWIGTFFLKNRKPFVLCQHHGWSGRWHKLAARSKHGARAHRTKADTGVAPI